MLRILDAFFIAELLISSLYILLKHKIAKNTEGEKYYDSVEEFFIKLHIILIFGIIAANIAFIVTSLPYVVKKFYTSYVFGYTYIISVIINFNIFLRKIKLKDLIWSKKFAKAKKKIKLIENRKKIIENETSNNSEKVVELLNKKQEKIENKLLYDTANVLLKNEEKKKLKELLFKK